MVIYRILLSGYRNFLDLELTFGNGVNIFYGDNAQGKTNLLEAMLFCATARAPRASNDKELINFCKNEAHIQILTKDELKSNEKPSENYYENKIDIYIKRDVGKNGVSKAIAINGVGIKKIGDLLGNLITVSFSPEDLRLVKAGPSERRRFIDMEMCQISNVYCHDLQQYMKILKQRNNLLKLIKTEKGNFGKGSAKQLDKKGEDVRNEVLEVWDDQLVMFGVKIYKKRLEFVEKINEYAKVIHNKIANEQLEIVYKPNVMKENFKEKLTKNFERDIFLGTTSTGIHKDDLEFTINGNDVRLFGSQGQQRTAALSAKLAEIEIVKNTKSLKPVLLLDDVFSELDEVRQTFLMDSIKDIQSFITCTGVSAVVDKVKSKYQVYKVKNGTIEKTER